MKEKLKVEMWLRKRLYFFEIFHQNTWSASMDIFSIHSITLNGCKSNSLCAFALNGNATLIHYYFRKPNSIAIIAKDLQGNHLLAI